MGSATSRTGIFSWGNYIKDHVGGDVGKVLGTMVDASISPAVTVTETPTQISQGFKNGGVLGAAGSLLGGLPMSEVAPIMFAVGQEKYLDDAYDIADDLADPLNLLPGGWQDTQAQKKAEQAAADEKIKQDKAFADANILGIEKMFEKRKLRKSGLGTSIFGGAQDETNYKTLLGV